MCLGDGFLEWSLRSVGVKGGFMAGGVLEELQRSRWGIWCGRRSNGYCLSILLKCKNVLLCCGVTLCFAVVIFALCYGWSRMSVSIQWGILLSLKCDCCLKLIFVFIVPYLKASTNLPHIRLLAIGARQFVHSGFVCVCLVSVVCASVKSGRYCCFEM